MLNVFLITLLPAYVGTRIRKWKPLLADGLEKPLKIALPLLLALIYTGVVLLEKDGESVSSQDIISIFPFTLALHLAAMSTGVLVTRLAGLKLRDRFTIVIEVGLQNSALAIFVSTTLLKSQAMSLVPVVYGAFTFFTTLLFGWIVKKLSRKEFIEKDR